MIKKKRKSLFNHKLKKNKKKRKSLFNHNLKKKIKKRKMMGNLQKCSLNRICAKFIQEDVWIHKGVGNLCKKNDYVTNTIYLNKKQKIPFEKFTKTKDLFYPIDKYGYGSPFVIPSKPKNCIWFSRGRWLYNPFNEKICEYVSPDDCFTTEEFIVIQHPKKIFHIRNMDDMKLFTEKYITEKKDIKDEEDDDESFDDSFLVGLPCLEVEKIKQDGFYGFAIHFCKWYELDDSKNKMRLIRENCHYNWQLSYDVESLCILDLRAFNNEGYVVQLNT
jgi:hypothetical protein